MSENDNKDLRAKIRSLFESESFGTFNFFYLCQSTPHNSNFQLVKGVFITSITGISALVSFSFALSSARKRNPVAPDDVSAQVYNSGAKLALRALKWGTFYAVTGCGLLIFGVWKAANVNNVSRLESKQLNLHLNLSNEPLILFRWKNFVKKWANYSPQSLKTIHLKVVQNFHRLLTL